MASAAVLTLTDGREFKDYRIISQTPTTVVVRYATGAIKVEKKLLPADVQGKYPIDAAGATAEAAEIVKGKTEYEAKVAEEKARQAKEGAAFRAQLKQEMDANAARGAGATAGTAPAPVARVLGPLEVITKKARAHAEHYFRYEYLAGVSGAVVTRLDIDLEEPTPVEGWPGRYALEGNCAFEYYDSVAIGYNKKVADAFRMLVEYRDGQAKVVDFSNHYAPR